MKYYATIFFIIFSLKSYGGTLAVGSDYPIGIHGEGTFSFVEDRIYLRARYARFLEIYTDSMNSVSQSLDFYNEATGAIITELLSNGNFFEMGLGWQQNTLTGWHFDVSLSRVDGKGQILGSTIVSAVAEVALPAGTNIYDVDGEITMLGLNGGYKWPLTETSSINLRFGILKPIASKVELYRETANALQQRLLEETNAQLDDYLADVLTSDVYIPVLGIDWVYFF